MSSHNILRISLIAFTSMALVFTSCKKNETEEANPTESFRGVNIDYSVFTSTTPYNNEYFEDANGDSTVDRRDGQNLLRMINALNAEARKGNSAVVSASLLNNMFFNTGNAFTGTYADLNSVDNSIYKITATSKWASLRDDVVTDFNSYFNDLAAASVSYANTASLGNAGVLTNGASKYLVDAKGVELVQVMQKSLIGAVQLDYIGNYLLREGLNADNSKLVDGQKYTELEHNWDIAFGLYSLNSTLYTGYTDDVAGTPRESLIGSYVWEYNKADYSKMQVAFLKGRAAIMNGDMDQLKTQATFIRNAMEYAIGAAAVGYLKKWSDNLGTAASDDAIRAHAIGEGAGFIYSIRFCYKNDGDESFSDTQLNALELSTGDGFWALSAPKVTPVSNAIKSKFGL